MASPTKQTREERFKNRLEKAGYASPSALPIFLAIQAGLMLFGVLVGGLLGYVFFGLTQRTLFALLAGGGIGYRIPDVVLKLMSERIVSPSHRPPSPPSPWGEAT